MGFFSARNNSGTPITCALCSKELGLNRYLIGKTASGNSLWKCPTCAKKGGYLKIMGEKAYFCDKDGNLLDTPNYYEETRMKCDTCGHVFCYTQADLEENQRLAKSALGSSISGIAGALGGYYAASSNSTQNANDQLARMVDYSKCPKCNSRNLRKLSKAEFEQEKAAQPTATPTAPAASAADELKKFKELLDIGIITQEEFDAKKKQLLGL